jgi:hypothetical protein
VGRVNRAEKERPVLGQSPNEFYVEWWLGVWFRYDVVIRTIVFKYNLCIVVRISRCCNTDMICSFFAVGDVSNNGWTLLPNIVCSLYAFIVSLIFSFWNRFVVLTYLLATHHDCRTQIVFFTLFFSISDVVSSLY